MTLKAAFQEALALRGRQLREDAVACTSERAAADESAGVVDEARVREVSVVGVLDSTHSAHGACSGLACGHEQTPCLIGGRASLMALTTNCQDVSMCTRGSLLSPQNRLKI